MSEVTIVLPAVSDDAVSEWLVALTEQVCKVTGGTGTYGLLGGSHGYGEDFENEVFMLHRYCWCEQNDCPWCLGCTCPDEGAVHYFLADGSEVSDSVFFDNGGYSTGNVKLGEKACAYCKGEAKPAPNFLHKPTGATVHWYKYIGRGMEVSEADWPAIFRECFASLQATP